VRQSTPPTSPTTGVSVPQQLANERDVRRVRQLAAQHNEIRLGSFDLGAHVVEWADDYGLHAVGFQARIETHGWFDVVQRDEDTHVAVFRVGGAVVRGVATQDVDGVRDDWIERGE